jgi:hypothetical protein
MISDVQKLWIRLGMAAMCLAILVGAGEKVSWSQGFEDRVAGSEPGGWGGKWGTQGDDQLIVSNLRAVSGQKSLLLDRTGGNTAMWGVSKGLPDVKEGWLHLSFAFLVQGAGHDARFGFEIREGVPSQRKVAGLRFGGSRVEAIPMSESGGYLSSDRVRLGGFAKGVWHRVDLWLPASGSSDRHGAAQLFQYRGDGKWEPVTLAQPLPVLAPPDGRHYGQLMFVASPGARGYRLFVDDLRVESAPALPETK